MTITQAIKKHDLKPLNSEHRPYTTFYNQFEDNEKIKTISIEQYPDLPIRLTIYTLYKNKLVRYGKTDSYRRKTLVRTYELKE